MIVFVPLVRVLYVRGVGGAGVVRAWSRFVCRTIAGQGEAHICPVSHAMVRSLGLAAN